MEKTYKPYQDIRHKILKTLYTTSNVLGLEAGCISVLCYHSFSDYKDRYSISPSTFAEHIRTLSTYAQFLSTYEVEEAIRTGKEYTKPAVCITIDDGYRDALEIVPIVRAYNIPVTVFVMSDPKQADRKQLKHAGKLLSWKEISFLQQEGWTIGCHSMTHQDFSTLSLGQTYREINIAKRILEEKLHAPVSYFSYPRGVWNTRVIQAVKYAEYKAAFGVSHGSVTSNTSKFLIPRTIIDKSVQASDFPFTISKSAFAARTVFDKLPVRSLL